MIPRVRSQWGRDEIYPYWIKNVNETIKPDLRCTLTLKVARVLWSVKPKTQFLESRACWIKYMEPFFHDLVDDILMTSKLAGSQDFDFKGCRDSPERCLRFSVTMGFACGNLWFRWSRRHGVATGNSARESWLEHSHSVVLVGRVDQINEWHILYTSILIHLYYTSILTDIQSSNPCWSLCEDSNKYHEAAQEHRNPLAFFDVLRRMMVVKIHRCNFVLWLHWRPMLSQREFGRNVWRVKMGILYRDVVGINKQQNRMTINWYHQISSNINYIYLYSSTYIKYTHCCWLWLYHGSFVRWQWRSSASASTCPSCPGTGDACPRRKGVDLEWSFLHVGVSENRLNP